MRRSPEYKARRSMLSRCYHPSRKTYHRYGGRGITVCKRWRESFENFFEDVGLRPSKKYTLGRIDNDKGYFPGNVEWQTWKQQNNNRCDNKKKK